MARQLNIHTLRVEKKPLLLAGFIRRKLTSELSEEGGGGGDKCFCNRA